MGGEVQMTRGISPEEVEDGYYWSTDVEEVICVRRGRLTDGQLYYAECSGRSGWHRLTDPKLGTLGLDGRLIPLDLPPEPLDLPPEEEEEEEELLMVEVGDEPFPPTLGFPDDEEQLQLSQNYDVTIKRIPKECPSCGEVFEEGGEVEL